MGNFLVCDFHNAVITGGVQSRRIVDYLIFYGHEDMANFVDRNSLTLEVLLKLFSLPRISEPNFGLEHHNVELFKAQIFFFRMRKSLCELVLKETKKLLAFHQLLILFLLASSPPRCPIY